MQAHSQLPSSSTSWFSLMIFLAFIIFHWCLIDNQVLACILGRYDFQNHRRITNFMFLQIVAYYSTRRTSDQTQHADHQLTFCTSENLLELHSDSAKPKDVALQISLTKRIVYSPNISKKLCHELLTKCKVFSCVSRSVCLFVLGEFFCAFMMLLMCLWWCSMQ